MCLLVHRQFTNHDKSLKLKIHILTNKSNAKHYKLTELRSTVFERLVCNEDMEKCEIVRYR